MARKRENPASTAMATSSPRAPSARRGTCERPNWAAALSANTRGCMAKTTPNRLPAAAARPAASALLATTSTTKSRPIAACRRRQRIARAARATSQASVAPQDSSTCTCKIHSRALKCPLPLRPAPEGTPPAPASAGRCRAIRASGHAPPAAARMPASWQSSETIIRTSMRARSSAASWVNSAWKYSNPSPQNQARSGMLAGRRG